MHLQNKLYEQGNSYESQYKNYFEQNQSLQAELTKNEKEMNQLKNELLQKRKAVTTYEYLLRQPATSTIVNKAMTRANAVKCDNCGKCFVSNDYLEAHKERRHNNPKSHSVEVLPQRDPAIDIAPIMSTLNTFMSQQLQILTEANMKGMQVMKDLYESKIHEIQEVQKSFRESQSQQGFSFLQEDQISKDYYEKQSLIEDQKRKIEENERKIRDLKLNQEIIQKKKMELEMVAQEVQAEEPEMTSQIPVVVRNEINQRMREQIENTVKSPKEIEKIVVNSEVKNFSSSNAGELEADSASESEQVIIEKLKSNANELEDDSVSEEENLIQNPQKEFDEDIMIAPKKETISAEIRDFKGSIETQIDFPEINVNEVCKLLGIDPTLDKRYVYIAKQYLAAPLPYPWQQEKLSGEIVYTNERTKNTTTDHPGIAHYSNIFTRLRDSHDRLEEKIRPLLQKPNHLAFHEKYTIPIETYFYNDYSDLLATREKIQNDYDVLLKNFSEDIINEKMRNDPKYLSARIEIFNKLDVMVKEYKKNPPKPNLGILKPLLVDKRQEDVKPAMKLVQVKSNEADVNLKSPEIKPRSPELKIRDISKLALPIEKYINKDESKEIDNKNYLEVEEEKKVIKDSSRLDDNIMLKEARQIQGVEHIQQDQSLKDPITDKSSSNFREGTVFGERHFSKNSITQISTQKSKKMMLTIGNNAILKLMNRDTKKFDVELFWL